jgi:hypothetical protein
MCPLPLNAMTFVLTVKILKLRALQIVFNFHNARCRPSSVFFNHRLIVSKQNSIWNILIYSEAIP